MINMYIRLIPKIFIQPYPDKYINMTKYILYFVDYILFFYLQFHILIELAWKKMGIKP